MPAKIMLRLAFVCTIFLGSTNLAHAQSAALTGGYPQVLVVTTAGEIVIELDARRAPVSAQHFLKLVEDGYYTGTIFHRVVPGFVVQGGGHTIDFTAKSGAETVFNESGNGLSNQRGSVALARTNDPHSADSQFYINLADNSRLDPRRDRWGYAVFGQVIEGMSVVDDMAAVPTGPGGPFEENVPTLPIVVKSMTRLTDEDIAARAQAAIDAAEAELELLELNE
ncbi:MAG: peptidylprolyl isomerase [Pseudomonadota bacterium]